MTDTTLPPLPEPQNKVGDNLVKRIYHEADIASRTGQFDRINAIAHDVEKVLDDRAALLKRIAEIESQLAAAEKDARRYRWLRGINDGKAVITWLDGSCDEGLALEALDNAIDAAMKASA